jgi:hypothetical protein
MPRPLTLCHLSAPNGGRSSYRCQYPHQLRLTGEPSTAPVAFMKSVPWALDSAGYARRSLARTEQEQIAPVDRRSFRDQLAFSIGFAVTRSRELLRRILKEHASDDARQQLEHVLIAQNQHL